VRGLVALLEEGAAALVAEGDRATLGVYRDHLRADGCVVGSSDAVVGWMIGLVDLISGNSLVAYLGGGGRRSCAGCCDDLTPPFAPAGMMRTTATKTTAAAATVARVLTFWMNRSMPACGERRACWCRCPLPPHRCKGRCRETEAETENEEEGEGAAAGVWGRGDD
jgi:hypothetical protein